MKVVSTKLSNGQENSDPTTYYGLLHSIGYICLIGSHWNRESTLNFRGPLVSGSAVVKAVQNEKSKPGELLFNCEVRRHNKVNEHDLPTKSVSKPCLMCNRETNGMFITCEECYYKINDKAKKSGKELDRSLVDDIVGLVSSMIAHPGM